MESLRSAVGCDRRRLKKYFGAQLLFSNVVGSECRHMGARPHSSEDWISCRRCSDDQFAGVHDPVQIGCHRHLEIFESHLAPVIGEPFLGAAPHQNLIEPDPVLQQPQLESSLNSGSHDSHSRDGFGSEQTSRHGSRSARPEFGEIPAIMSTASRDPVSRSYTSMIPSLVDSPRSGFSKTRGDLHDVRGPHRGLTCT